MDLSEKRVARFWKKVRKSDGCWEWMAALYPSGYGAFYDGTMTSLASRYSWTLHNGSIPRGAFVCHKCDNPLCIRPDHLFIGTQTDNMRDCIAKGRHAHGAAKSPVGLTEWDARAIRLSSAAGESQRSVARRFGVSRATVIAISKRKTWRHV